MRFSNKLKIVQIIILVYISIMLSVTAMGQGMGGPPIGVGGPPPPPQGFCDQNPTDPSCNLNNTIPVGSDESIIMLLLVAAGLGYYKLK